MGIVVIGDVFIDIKGYSLSPYIPQGRNAGTVIQIHGGRCEKRGGEHRKYRAETDIYQCGG